MAIIKIWAPLLVGLKSIYFCLKNKLIWDRPKVPTKIDFLIIDKHINKIAERYKTYIQQISDKQNKINKNKLVGCKLHFWSVSNWFIFASNIIELNYFCLKNKSIFTFPPSKNCRFPLWCQCLQPTNLFYLFYFIFCWFAVCRSGTAWQFCWYVWQ